MSELRNCLYTLNLPPESRLLGKLFMFSTCELPHDTILSPLVAVLQAVEKQMAIEGVPFDIGLPINVCFSDKEEFTLRLLPEEKAIASKIIFYSLPRLKPYYGSKTLYMILAEELCHAIWNIHDEMIVSFKVFDVLRNIFPDLDIREIYSQEIAAQHRKWLLDQSAACSP